MGLRDLWVTSLDRVLERGRRRSLMRVYHRTPYAEAIMRDGFRDSAPILGEFRGVFVSADGPLDQNEGALGDRVIAIDVPRTLFVEYELCEAEKPYREAMIPASDLNPHPRRLLTEAELADESGALLASPPGAEQPGI